MSTIKCKQREGSDEDGSADVSESCSEEWMWEKTEVVLRRVL